MPDIINADAYRELLVSNIPLIDTRAPVEFNKGSLPAAVNLPLLDDEERRQVGIRYREAGQEAAIRLGQKLVAGTLRERRIRQWTDFIGNHPDAALFCFRGGLRSRTTQQWLAAAGIAIPRVAGGYKAMRRYLMNTLLEACGHCNFLLVAGKTGCAKTRLINRLSPSLDLEGLANHRGSAFGRRVQPQPSPADFENALAIDLLRLPYERFSRVILEDESRAIGSLSLPFELYARMQQAPVAVIEEPVLFRANTVLHEYVEVNYSDYRQENPQTAEARFSEYLLGSLQRIQRRLGSTLYTEIRRQMELALQQHFQQKRVEAHLPWIEKLLTAYYDPMYEYQLEKKLQRLVFRGNSQEFVDWAAHLKYEMD